MLSISEALAHVEATGPSTFKNLSLFPLHRPDLTASEPDYLLLEEAIMRGLARVTEVSAAGSSCVASPDGGAATLSAPERSDSGDEGVSPRVF